MESRPQTKIAIVLREDLLPWQRLNVTAFLASGIAATWPELIGEPYADADDTAYLPLFGHPVLVFQSDVLGLRAAVERSVRRELRPAVFTADMFATGNDVDNRAVVHAVPTAELDLVGVAVYGPRNGVDRVTKGCVRHP